MGEPSRVRGAFAEGILLEPIWGAPDGPQKEPRWVPSVFAYGISIGPLRGHVRDVFRGEPWELWLPPFGWTVLFFQL